MQCGPAGGPWHKAETNKGPPVAAEVNVPQEARQHATNRSSEDRDQPTRHPNTGQRLIGNGNALDRPPLGKKNGTGVLAEQVHQRHLDRGTPAAAALISPWTGGHHAGGTP